MFGHQFYNETTRRYVAMFGTIFNDIKITRDDNTDTTVQTLKVPVNYGPREKFISRLEQDPNLTAPAITLPRISFEITGMQYNPSRKLAPYTTYDLAQPNSSAKSVFTAMPYDISFQLTIMTKYAEDGTKIVEQILPFFTPDFTPSVKLVDDLDIILDIPIVLNGVQHEDIYEGSFEERRVLTWTLDFTVKGYYFGPVQDRKVIKFAKVGIYSAFDATDPSAEITYQPGLTANGTPTTDINQTVPYADINESDDWGYIVTIEDFE